ncbi:ATP-binding cassette transporter [Mycena kentingensis (nom. inval.)]|nr:ATP-binding cassette transporter [Mycena kentingensis (nom. inval.)]
MDASLQFLPDIQVVLNATRLPQLESTPWTRTLVFPLYAAALSSLTLLIQSLRRSSNGPRKSWKDPSRYGGPPILALNILRLLSTLSLLGLSVASILFVGAETRDELIVKWGLSAFYLYASILVCFALDALSTMGMNAEGHLNAILAVAAAVFFYRDILPLATYTWPVMDAGDGPILTAQLVALFIAAVAIPLVTPRLYVPVDPNNPMEKPNPEQTASILSLLLFSFLDPVVSLARKLPHLPYDELPPLADTDDAAHLKARGFRDVDTFSGANPNRHIFFGILHIFRSEYTLITLLLFIYVGCSFSSPIGINRVLTYLENGAGDSEIRPFVWILWLALGPLTGTVAIQVYYRVSMRILVQVEGMLTELIFEHALRVRVKADTASTESKETASDDETLNPDSASDASSQTAAGAASTTSKDPKAAPGGGPSSSVDVGQISNYVTTDLRNVTQMSDFLLLLFYMPTTVVFCVIFLYIVLGWSSFIGMITMIILFPLSGLAAKILQKIQINRIKAADARVKTITETMGVMRMIKLFGWEEKMLKRVNDKREAELVWIFSREIFEWVANTTKQVPGPLHHIRYIVGPVACFVGQMLISVSTLAMKRELRPSIVFSTMPVFDMLRNQLHMMNYRIIQFIDAKVSIDRINSFLHNTELLDAFADKDSNAELLAAPTAEPESTEIGFRDATFTWSNEVQDGTVTPSRQRFTLRIPEELLFKRGGINLVLGPTGSGKTSLLMALLGEMHFVPPSPGSWFNLPRSGGVSYAAQESWVLNETIRDNILFGAPLDEERYKKVLFQCALEPDLQLFEAGDKTEVGEKGLTLSGGQKARCTLARAIYSKAEIILLDDVLAALDVHTSKHIVEHCFKGDLVRDRTVILVTHNVALATPIADFVVTLGSNGRIKSQGTVAEALKRDSTFAREVVAEAEALEEVVDPDAAPAESKPDEKDGKLILAEEMQLGRVGWNAIALYLKGLGGFWFYLTFFGFLTISQLTGIFQTWYLGFWAAFHLGIYASLSVFDVVTHSIADVVFAYACLRASRVIHFDLIKSVLGTTLRWLDVTPTSRVIARFTADITALDGPILNVFAGFVFVSMNMIASFGAVCFLTPLFAVPGVLAALIGGLVGQLFIKAQLSVKRESSNAKAPVLAHFSAAIAGLPSIRAYGAQTPFINESLRRINKYTRAVRTLNNLDRWVAVRLAVVGNSLAALLAFYLVYIHQTRANDVGFSLNMAAGFSMRILFWVRIWNDVQIQGNSLERILQYIHIEQEQKPTEHGKPPAHWPSSGELVVENLSASYSPGGPKVLKNISFTIKAGERVGIVGRTGSGKSSLTLALLRCIYTDGTVRYDGIPTSKINLDALRSNITIIPQMPELLSGTLRHNLDPFEQYDDADLNSALRAAGLSSLQEEMEEGRLTLDSVISSGGSNLSVGQRQILALARAIVRESKLLILDEATSAIDYDTDKIIQASLRTELKPGVTCIVVAHRLQTILDSDKIMVLDEGRIVEFDAPSELLKNPKGKLRSLVDESGEKDALYALAEKR